MHHHPRPSLIRRGVAVSWNDSPLARSEDVLQPCAYDERLAETLLLTSGYFGFFSASLRAARACSVCEGLLDCYRTVLLPKVVLRHARCVSCAGERSRLLLRACGPLQRQSNARSTQDGANRRSILDTGTTGALLRMGARRFGICNPKMRVSGDDATVWSGRLHANRSLSMRKAKPQGQIK